MAIETKRTGSDRVEIYADDKTYYLVQHEPVTGYWNVRRRLRGVATTGTLVGKHKTAEAAVNAVKTMLAEQDAELTAALDKLL